MVKCVSSAFLLHSTLLFLYCSKIVYVSAYLGIEVDMHTKKRGGGCVRVSGRGATDVYKQMTPKGGVCMCQRSQWD